MVEMLMEVGMALEPCQHDPSADDEPRRGSLLSESDSDMEDAKESASATESNELPPIDGDSGESRAAPHRAPKLGELSRDSMMDGSQLEFFDAPDHFLEFTDDTGKAAPTMDSNDITALVNNSKSFRSNSFDGKPIECGKSKNEPQNSIHCKDFIDSTLSAEMSGQPHSASECEEIVEQLYSISESENNNGHPHGTPESENHHNNTDYIRRSDQACMASQSEYNSDQLHHATEYSEICDQVQTVTRSGTVHLPHYIKDSTDGSEKPTTSIECGHSLSESKQVSDQTSSTAKSANSSDQASSATLSEDIVDRHKTTEARDVDDHINTKTESDVTCDQQVNLTESKVMGCQCKNAAEPETINQSILIVASEEICYLPHNTTESENISGDSHCATEDKEDSKQPETKREFEEISEQTSNAIEPKETSCREITEKINRSREAEGGNGQINNATKCEEVVGQLHNMTKSEVCVELCSSTMCEETKDFPQSTVESKDISSDATESAQIIDKPHHTTESVVSGQSLCAAESEWINDQLLNNSYYSEQLHNTTESGEPCDRLQSPAESADIIDQSHSATEASETADQSSGTPLSEKSGNQTCKAKLSTENYDVPQNSMEAINHSNAPPISTVSAEHSDPLNSIDRASDLSIAVKNKDFKEVSDKSELGESTRVSQSNVQSNEIEAVCQSDGFTIQTLNNLPINVNVESSDIPQACINSQEDIEHERGEPIASDMVHPLDIVLTDTLIVKEDDSERCYNERVVKASEDKIHIEDTSHDSNVTEPIETTAQSHQSNMSLETNDGSSSDSAFPESHGEPQKATEFAEPSQGNPADQDHDSGIGVQSFVADTTASFFVATHLLDSICLPGSDAEAMKTDDPGLEVEGKVVSDKDSSLKNLYNGGPAGMDISEGLPMEDVDVQEIKERLSEQDPLIPSNAGEAGCTDSLEPDSRISLNEQSESAVVHPSASYESLDACPQSLVSYKPSVDEDKTKHSGGVELETVVQIVDQTHNPDPSPEILSASFPSAWIGQKPTPCEMTEEVDEMQEPTTEEHESQKNHQRPTSTNFEPHSEILTTANFDERLQPDSELVPAEGATAKPEVFDQTSYPSDVAKKDDLAWNVPDGQQGDLHRENSELKQKLLRLVHQTSSTEGQQAPFYVTEEWKEVLQSPNQRVYFRLKQEVGSPSVDFRETFSLAPETKSESGQLDPLLCDLNLLTEPHHEELKEDTQETDGVAVGANAVRINTQFMKFLGHVPKFFGEAGEELGELPPESGQRLDEVDGVACQTSDINSSTSIGHETQQDSSVWDSSVNSEGINIPLTGKQTTPINFFSPTGEFSPEETRAFFKRDIVPDLQDDSPMLVSSENTPMNHFDASLHSHTSIPHAASMNEYDIISDTKHRSSSLLVADSSPMPDLSPTSESVFHSPQPSPVTVIAGTAETEPHSRPIWMPTWKVPDDSVMQLLSKKISPKLPRRGSKIYRTTGGVAAMNKDSQNRHSTPVLISHSPLEDQTTPKSFQVALAPTQSKPLFRQAALPEVSEETPGCDQEDTHHVGKIISGRLRVRDEFEQRTTSSIASEALNRPRVQILISEGEFSQAKPYTSPVKTQNEAKRIPASLAVPDSRSQEDLTSRTAKSQAWHRKGVRKTTTAASEDDEPQDEETDLSASDPVHLRGKNFANQTSNMVRRRSKLIDSSRLLYQEYSDVALNHAIERQKRTDTFLEESEPSSPRLRRKLMSSPDSYLQRLSVSSSASLWQDIPMIRGTSALLSMTREEQKLQEAKFELIMSEASYLRSLNIAVDHFQRSPELQTLLSNQERQWLFSRLQEVRDVSSDFLFDLEEKFEDNMYTFNVCDVVLSHAPAIRKVYLPYVTNQSYQDQTFRQLLSGNPRFQQVLEKLESDSVCQRLSLKSFLILPFQRITRLKLLVQNILKRTRLGSREEAQATQAYNLMEKLIKDCNENVQRMRSTEELIYLSQKIEFECKIFPLISQSRRLVKQGELIELEYGSPLSFKWKVITRPVYLHLFNDCLLLSRRREGSRFVVFDHAPTSKVRGEKCEIKLHGTNKNIFRMTLQENNQGRRVEFLLRTDTQSEKLRWISALAPRRKKPDLMECHDNPQVQCLKSYKARENDELSLEKADVLMVTQQSKDGWIEGTRLSDGEQGWFPVENVEDISNKHVRLRNLKEEHRVQCARAKLMPLPHRR